MMIAFLSSLLLLMVPYQAVPGLDDRLKEVIHSHGEEKDEHIGYIEIDDRSSGINNSTWLYVQQAVESFKVSKPLFVVLKLNTPGGESLAAMQICDALKELDSQFGIPVIAYIDNWAMSAGALIAYACRFITVVQDGGMGAAEPVLASQTGEMTSASEKINSAFRITFANQAAFFGRDPSIAEAMVDKDILLVKRGDKFLKLSSNDEIVKTGEHPDIVISPKGKLLTLTAKEMLEWGVADILFYVTKLNPLSPHEKEIGKWPLSKMYLSTYPFFEKFKNVEVRAYQMDLRLKFFAFLMHPAVASILMLGVMVGFYLEFSTPGATLPGSIAAICLFLLAISSFAFQIGSWLEIILLLGGVAIILIDLLVLPTFGILGFFGVLIFLAGLLGLVVPGLEKMTFDPSGWAVTSNEILNRVAWFIATLLIGVGVLIGLAYWFPARYNPFSRFVLQGEQEGYSAGGTDFDHLQGKTGTTLSPLRPAGRIEVDGVPYDAQSSGDFIPKGDQVTVERIEGARLFVRRLRE